MKNGIITGSVFLALIAGFAWAANDWKIPGIEKKRPDVTPLVARSGTIVTQDRQPQEGECPNTCKRITLASDHARIAGLEVQMTELQTISEILQANAETRFPPDKYVRVAPRLPGIIREVKAVVGQEVSAGDTLAILESSELSRMKSEYLQALAIQNLRQKTFDREKEMLESKITSKRKYLEAETALEEAKLDVRRTSQVLRTIGLSEKQLADVAKNQDASPQLEVTAPRDGVVADPKAVAGEAASKDTALFCIADTSRFWIVIDVFESDLPRVEAGQRVSFTVEGWPGQRFPGQIVAVGTEVDDRTRTVRVYGDVKNVRGLLRANMFGRARIRVKDPEPKLVVPRAAIQNDGDCWLVFVNPIPNIFQARKVELGLPIGNGIEILGGLAAGEKIVTTGSFLLRTEVLRGQIGAG